MTLDSIELLEEVEKFCIKESQNCINLAEEFIKKPEEFARLYGMASGFAQVLDLINCLKGNYDNI